MTPVAETLAVVRLWETGLRVLWYGVAFGAELCVECGGGLVECLLPLSLCRV